VLVRGGRGGGEKKKGEGPCSLKKYPGRFRGKEGDTLWRTKTGKKEGEFAAPKGYRTPREEKRGDVSCLQHEEKGFKGAASSC